VDGHAIWVSSKVLEIAGDLPNNVEGGEILRDKDGDPTGWFIFPLAYDIAVLIDHYLPQAFS